MAGNAGSAALRSAPVTAKACTLPSRAATMAVVMLSNIICTRPASRSSIAGALPR